MDMAKLTNIGTGSPVTGLFSMPIGAIQRPYSWGLNPLLGGEKCWQFVQIFMWSSV